MMRVASRRRVMSAVGAVLAITLLATGCGRSDAPPESKASASLDDKPAEGVVEVWTAGGYQENLEPFLKTFTADNPDVKVKITDVPWGEMPNKLRTSIAAGQVPDAVMVGPVAPFLASGGLQPVPDGLDVGDLNQTALAIGQDRDGVQYSVPWYLDTRLFFYHSKVAQAVGAKTPTSWDEMYAFEQALMKVPAVEWGLGLPVGRGTNPEVVAQVLLPFIAQAGGSVLNDDRTEWTLDTPEVVEALKYYQGFFDRGISATTGISESAIPNFIQAKTASTFQGIFIAPMIDAAVEQKTGAKDWSEQNLTAAVVPAGAENGASYLGGAQWVVPTDAKNPDAAWKLIRWLSLPQTQTAWFEKSMDLPSNEKAWTSESITSDPWTSVAIKQLASTVSSPAVPNADAFFGALADETEKMVLGKQTPEQTAAALQKKADEIGVGW